MKKLRIIAICTLIANLLAGSLVAVSLHRRADRERNYDSWVDAQIHRHDLTENERAWEKIGWAPDLATALRLGARYHRPILVIAHAGALDGRT